MNFCNVSCMRQQAGLESANFRLCTITEILRLLSLSRQVTRDPSQLLERSCHGGAYNRTITHLSPSQRFINDLDEGTTYEINNLKMLLIHHHRTPFQAGTIFILKQAFAEQ